MAEPLSFKDFIVVNYTQSDDDLLAYQAHKRHRGTVGEACWQGYTQKGMKPKNGRMVPNCVPEEDQQQNEVLSVKGRLALSRAMKRRKNQLALARRRNRQRSAQNPRLQNRAKRQARNQLFKKLSGGKKRSDLSPARRAGLEKKVQSFASRVKAIARKYCQV